MEALGQNYGFVMYTTEFCGPAVLTVSFARDRVHVIVNGSVAAIIYRGDPSYSIQFGDDQPVSLQLLVENMGRLNYGTEMFDPKVQLMRLAFLRISTSSGCIMFLCLFTGHFAR
jgi:beta-galactosidase